MNQKIIVGLCKMHRKYFAITMEEKECNNWYAINSFKIEKKRACKGGFNPENLNGSFNIDYTYNGCPHCRNNNFVKCGQCGRITCSKTGDISFICRHCNNKGKIDGIIDNICGIDDI